MIGKKSSGSRCENGYEERSVFGCEKMIYGTTSRVFVY